MLPMSHYSSNGLTLAVIGYQSFNTENFSFYFWIGFWTKLGLPFAKNAKELFCLQSNYNKNNKFILCISVQNKIFSRQMSRVCY
jgi:hypothetical protein